MAYNKVIIVGNITRDVELKSFASGSFFTRFTVAVNRRYKDKDGNTCNKPSFIDVDAFGNQAEVIHKHFSKGKEILVEGRLETQEWEDRETGEKRSRITVVLESFAFTGNGGGKGGESQERQEEPKRWQKPSNNRYSGEDVPF